ncbi:leucine-rich PPR motif-containing protein, mitochondrial [Pleuronectes platessa]|uniref:leucine-rich PPR motif-containing protein, mitochondrial n=1 Tax=Pleuronectes platessa TaxID=8262 RepID=UPI00232A1D94|nr:leucine-rich PPR motif-containing protein, mitochondrial [Pleuronectes platessa]
MPFHTLLQENMAALLRSARLLRLSPSGLLHVAGTNRTGPPLGRLYSGALCGNRTAACSRLSRPGSDSVSISHVWPYSAGGLRGYAVAPDKKDEASVSVRSKQAQQFDWALAKLDSSVRRTGRITKTLLLRIFHDICRAGYPSGNQALLLLRSCGSLLPEVPLEERTVLAHRVWEKLHELGAQFDVSHYNALLKVYLQNEFKFSPTDFLAKMEAANVQPNRVTYQRLIAAYCHNGDIEGASTILGFMKTKDLPITEAVFNSLVTGHARAGDLESAKNILPVMRGAGIEPGPDTYLSLLNTYAEKGDLESLKKTMEEAESADCSLMDRDIMQIIFTLAKSGHQQLIPDMVERMRHERGYVPDAMNLCLSLITQGQDETAFNVLKSFSSLEPDNYNNDSPNLGNFFLRHCVTMNTSLEKLTGYCEELQKTKRHSDPLTFSLQCALEAKKTGLSFELMKILKEQGLPIRPHYFCPLLSGFLKDNNTAGVMEVLKGMQELGVTPDSETMSIYILPAFPSTEAARQAITEAGISLDSDNFLSLEVRSLAVSDLAKLYTQLSDPSFPPLDHNSFRNSLILGFRKSDDVESMAKITELLFKDKRFSKEGTKPAEGASYFLYNLFDTRTEEELQAQEDKLRKYLNQLQAQNIKISLNIFKGIRNLLESHHVPELVKDVIALVDPRDRASSGSASASPRFTGIEGKVVALEAKLAELKAQNQPLGLILKQTIQALCAEENLQRALELKQQHEEELTAGSYATLINLCCRHENVEEALNLKMELSRKDSSISLDAGKYIALVKLLSKVDRVEEAVDILKEMKEKDVAINDANVSMLFYALNSLVTKGAAPIRRLQDTIFTLGLAKPTANLCSPLISAYLESKDLPGALEAALEFQKLYNQLPRIHDILVALVEKGDTELLQKAMDFVSQERGEMNMLYDLFFAFLQTGRFREARKIIETPGLRARPGRLQWYAEKCIFVNQLETLEQMVDMTSKLFECDRDEMYHYVLRLCKESNNWEKAEAVWTKMQEENIVPRERTLRLLADILKTNGQEVPFEMPETWYERSATAQQEQSAPPPTTAEGGPEYQTRLLALCKRGKAKEAYGMLKKADKQGLTLTPAPYDHLIRALLADGAYDDAMVVKDIAVSRVPGFQLSNIATSLLIITHSKKGETSDALANLRSMIQAGHVPSQLAITRLVQAQGGSGDMAGIQEVESLMQSLGTNLNLSSMVFVSNKALAYIKNDDVDSAVDLLESVYTSPDSSSPGMSFVFRKVMEDDNEQAIDKLSAMAEKLANQFACYRPAVDLFLQLLDMDKLDEAKFMLARCNAVAEQKDMLVSYVARKAQFPGQVGKIKALMSLIPDFTEKEVLYPYLMKCHVTDKDLESAKALHEQIQKEGMAVDELSLKRLAALYRNAGETAPFTEPPESFKFYADQLKDRAAKAQVAADE